MEELKITVGEYQDKVISEVDKAISPLKTIRDLTKILAKENIPLQVEDCYSLYKTLDSCIKQIQDIILII